ncbi:hypothetical protein CPter91_2253 [Collimonas pratensis]|uniref:Uncharacterized protein n=1 Tax=Collimonas pratensis TaxID=279113 RepID=A0A127Q3J2_9BURK|nr:hypothetical protein CPter91_2253 [Collimonas pratensis]
MRIIRNWSRLQGAGNWPKKAALQQLLCTMFFSLFSLLGKTD